MNGAGSAVKSHMGTLSELIGHLDNNYSKEAARLEQGGELTANERKQLDLLKAQQKELMAKLDQVLPI